VGNSSQFLEREFRVVLNFLPLLCAPTIFSSFVTYSWHTHGTKIYGFNSKCKEL